MAEVGKKTEKKTQAGRDVYRTPEGEMVSEKSTSTHSSQKEAEKAARERSENLKFNKGGTPMMEQQARLFRRGGLNDEGGQIDKESGNKVPVGGTKKGVRDDIPINISEGEFIFPEDVTRYIGLKELMNMRQEAKMGLKKMEAMGLMGNADEATIPDDLPFTMDDLIVVQVADKEGSEKDRADMKTGGLGSRSRLLSTPQVSPQPIVVEEGEKVVTDIMEAVEYRNAAGNSIIIMHYGGSPMYPIPAGYSRYDPETGELGEVVNPVTETVKEVNDVVTRASQSGKDKAPELPENEFTKAGSWENSPLDMYIKEAKKFSDGSSSIATSIMGVMGASGFGLLTYGLVKLEKRKILNTIDDRIKNATGKQKQELIRIRDTLLGKIKGPNFIEKITNFVDGILAPEEVKTEIKNTIVKDVNQPATVNNPEEVLPYGLTKTDLDAFRGQDVFDISQQAPLDAFSGQDVFDISQQAPITNLLGPIEEVAARDVPVEVSQTYDQELFNNLKNTISLGKKDDPRLPPEYRGGEGSEGYNRIISEAEKFYGKNIVQDVLNSLTPVVPTATRGVQDRGFVPSNIAQPAATAESIAPTLTTTTPVQQPSVSQIDYSNIQTSGPPSVPDALRTPLGTAAAESALKQEATLPQSYDSSVDDLVRQTREALGTTDQSIEETIAKAQEVISKDQPLRIEGTTSEPTFTPSANQTDRGFVPTNIAQPSNIDTTTPQPNVFTAPQYQEEFRFNTGQGDTRLKSLAEYGDGVVSERGLYLFGNPQQPVSDLYNLKDPIVMGQVEDLFGKKGASNSFPSMGSGPDYYDAKTEYFNDLSAQAALERIRAEDQTEQAFFGEGDPFAYMFETPISIPTATPIVSSASSLAPDESLRPQARPTETTETTQTGLSSFEQAFANARAAGQDTFPFEGKTYTTKLASDTEPAVKAASDDKYGGATVTGNNPVFRTAFGSR